MMRRIFLAPSLVLLAAVCCLGSGPSAAATQKKAGQDKEVIVLQVAGKLTATDAKDRVRQSSHHRVHEVQLQAGKHYGIDLVSAAFDAFLRLEDEAGKHLAEDDDGGGGTNARLVWAAARTGRYRII